MSLFVYIFTFVYTHTAVRNNSMCGLDQNFINGK